MINEIKVNLGNLYLSLSDAIDLANPRIASHQMRTAYISWQIAQNARLGTDQIERVFLSALFHDVGALSIEEKIRLINSFEDDLDTHCKLGEAICRLSPLFEPGADIIRNHHKPWGEWEDNIDKNYVHESQIVFLADLVERLINRKEYILHQVEDIKKAIKKVSNREVHPEIIDTFMDVAKREEFWLDIVSPRLYSILLRHGPFKTKEISIEPIYQVSLVMRSIIDFRSRFTATHSTGVAKCASLLSQIFGLTDHEVELMEIAGNFHDLGKLAVPNSILEHPGPLSKEEFAIIKQHTYHTYTVLNSIGGLDQIAEWAAFHHEKLDGSGYPFKIGEGKLNIGTRIMTVADIFVAIAENRPYRDGLSYKSIKKILLDQVKSNQLDKRIVDIIIEDYGIIHREVKKEQEIAASYYYTKFKP